MKVVAATKNNRGSRIAIIGAIAGFIVAGAGLLSAQANEPNSVVFKPLHGLSYHFGSKIAVGYFTQAGGACALTMFLADDAGDSAGPSAARLQINVAPGDSAKLTSPEHESLEVKCGPNAATLEVKGGSTPARFASRQRGNL